jgi:hypothetical protein
MIESIIECLIVIIIGFVLIRMVRQSRKINKDLSKLNKDQRGELTELVNTNPKRYFVLGGSFTKLPLPLAILGNLLAFAVILLLLVLFVAPIFYRLG